MPADNTAFERWCDPCFSRGRAWSRRSQAYAPTTSWLRLDGRQQPIAKTSRSWFALPPGALGSRRRGRAPGSCEKARALLSSKGSTLELGSRSSSPAVAWSRSRWAAASACHFPDRSSKVSASSSPQGTPGVADRSCGRAVVADDSPDAAAQRGARHGRSLDRQGQRPRQAAARRAPEPCLKFNSWRLPFARQTGLLLCRRAAAPGPGPARAADYPRLVSRLYMIVPALVWLSQ
jgi:hypothetical protein